MLLIQIGFLNSTLASDCTSISHLEFVLKLCSPLTHKAFSSFLGANVIKQSWRKHDSSTLSIVTESVLLTILMFTVEIWHGENTTHKSFIKVNCTLAWEWSKNKFYLYKRMRATVPKVFQMLSVGKLIEEGWEIFIKL